MERVTMWRCPNCGDVEYADQERGCQGCIAATSTYFHREPVEFVRLDEVVAIVEAAAEGFEREQAVEQAEEDFRAANFAFQKARAMKDLAAQLKGQA